MSLLALGSRLLFPPFVHFVSAAMGHTSSILFMPQACHKIALFSLSLFYIVLLKSWISITMPPVSVRLPLACGSKFGWCSVFPCRNCCTARAHGIILFCHKNGPSPIAYGFRSVHSILRIWPSPPRVNGNTGVPYVYSAYGCFFFELFLISCAVF